jgi:hypothetical protein
MLKKPAGNLVGSAQASKPPWSAVTWHQRPVMRPSLGRRDLALHPVVAGEGGGHQVVHPVLDPFHRLAGDDRGDDGADVARIDADLVAEAAADVGRDDADVVLGDAEISEATVRTACGAWKVPQTVSLPLTLSIDATQPQVSSGQGWVRW